RKLRPRAPLRAPREILGTSRAARRERSRRARPGRRGLRGLGPRDHPGGYAVLFPLDGLLPDPAHREDLARRADRRGRFPVGPCPPHRRRRPEGLSRPGDAGGLGGPMAQEKPQNFANHRRIVPLYHGGVFGILAINFIWRTIAVIRAFSWTALLDN